METKTYINKGAELQTLAEKIAAEKVEFPSTKEAKKLFSKVDKLPPRKVKKG